MSELLSNLIQDYGKLFEIIAAFCVVFFGILVSSRILLYQLIYSFDLDAKSQHKRMQSLPVRVSLAISDMLAWLFAFTLTCLFFRLPQVLELFRVMGTLIPLFLVVFLIGYCFSRVGHELILSLIGCWYLQRHQEDLEHQRYFDLGGETMAEIQKIDLLATKFRIKEGGKTVFRPNAFLMQQFFGFTQGIGIEDIVKWTRSPRS